MPPRLILLFALAASCAATGERPWRTHDLGPFSLALPSDFTQVDVKPIDSLVGEWVGPGMHISSDYGQYSADVSTEAYFEKIEVDGRPARIEAPHAVRADSGHEFPLSTIIAFRDIKPGGEGAFGVVHLSVWANCQTLEECQVARRSSCPYASRRTEPASYPSRSIASTARA